MVIYHYCEYENIQNIFKMEEIKMNEMYQNQNVQPQQPMMMGGGYGGYPYQQPYQPQQPYYQQPYQYNYNTNNCGGITFGEMPKQASSTLTKEEQEKLEASRGAAWEFTELDKIKAADNYRDQNGNLLLEIDPNTGVCRTRYGDEFNMVITEPENIKSLCNMLGHVYKTAKFMDLDMPTEVSRELSVACGLVNKFLPEAYARGLKNVNKIKKAAQNNIMPTGYNGNMQSNLYNAINNGMYNTMSMPQCIINGAPQGGYMPQPQPGYYQPQPGGYYQQPQGYYQQPQQMMQQPMMNSPFYQQQPQQQMPQLTNISTNFGAPTVNQQTPQMNIPTPGQPQQNNNQAYKPATTTDNKGNIIPPVGTGTSTTTTTTKV